MRRGVRLGVDVGSVRVGVAVSDPDGLVAAPLETVPRGGSGGGLDRLVVLVRERGAAEVVVGLPRSLSGGEGPAAAAAREYAGRLAARLAAPGSPVPVAVRLVDERLTTVTAQHSLREGGVGGRKGRSVVDQVAAAVLLQSALDAERGSGRAPGELVPPGPAPVAPPPDGRSRP